MLREHIEAIPLHVDVDGIAQIASSSLCENNAEMIAFASLAERLDPTTVENEDCFPFDVEAPKASKQIVAQGAEIIPENIEDNNPIQVPDIDAVVRAHPDPRR